MSEPNSKATQPGPFVRRNSRAFRTCFIVGPVAFVAVWCALPKLDHREALEHPVPIGEVSHVNISFYVGDVSIPNKLEPISGNPNETRFWPNPRQKFWDAYLVTAPVARVFETTNGLALGIPWTLLPGSVCESVAQIDPSFAKELEAWLKIKASPAEWNFDRLLRKVVDQTNHYYQVTGVESIYAVNLFEFLKELGDDYQGNLVRAISSAAKESLELAGANSQRKMAFPALAAAHHVKDRELVISYDQSFESILDGVRRAEGNKPSEAILVVWRAWSSRLAEMNSVMRGLRKACFRKVAGWKERLNTVSLVAWSGAFIFGLIANYLARRRGREFPVVEFGAGLATMFLAVFGNKYLELSAGLLYLSYSPELEIAVVAQISALIGFYLHKTGVLRPWKKKTD